MSTNACTSAILSVFPKPHESVSLQKSCYVAGSITSQSFPDFLNLAESCREKVVFVQRHNTSLHSKFRQTALELTPKGLDYTHDYTQIDTLREPCFTDLWFWEVLGQSQSWLRTMQTDLWKLYVNSCLFEFLTPCAKIKLLRMRKNVIVFLSAVCVSVNSWWSGKSKILLCLFSRKHLEPRETSSCRSIRLTRLKFFVQKLSGNEFGANWENISFHLKFMTLNDMYIYLHILLSH